MQVQSIPTFSRSTPGSEAMASDYMALLKPRVMSLVIFTGLCGLLMAPGHIHPLLGFTAILCIAVGSGAAGCLNMWYDHDIDQIMERTRHRPIPSGRIQPEAALAFGIILSLGSIMILGVAVNWIAASLLAFTIFFYVVIYTVWLKRLTAQNIVIGGVAGAFPPVIGWLAVNPEGALEPWLLFAIIFLWTPPHFWALALNRYDDYRKAQVPMLPVTAGLESTRIQIVLYSWLLFGSALMPWILGMASYRYGMIASLLNVIFVVLAHYTHWSKNLRLAMKLFGFSITYLFLLFLSLTIDVVYFAK
jgi:protoheme IX farnesyltransferase